MFLPNVCWLSLKWRLPHRVKLIFTLPSVCVTSACVYFGEHVLSMCSSQLRSHTKSKHIFYSARNATLTERTVDIWRSSVWLYYVWSVGVGLRGVRKTRSKWRNKLHICP